MFLKKIYQPLEEGILDLSWDAPKKVQELSFPEAKAGKSFCLTADKREGKSTALCINVIQKLREEKDDVPRAIVVVADDEEGNKLEATMRNLSTHTSLRIFHSFKKRNITKDRDAIYMGMDIVIATIERLNELYRANGLNYTGLQMFAIDDAHLVVKPDQKAQLDKFTDRLPNCLFMLYAEKKTKGIERFAERHMEFIKTLKV